MKGYLLTSGGASLFDIAEHFEINKRTALRHIQALEAAREPLYEELVGRRKIWRLRIGEEPRGFVLTQGQMIALTLCRGLFDFLSGTGLEEDLRDLFGRLDRTLGHSGHRAQHMKRKLFVSDEAAPVYDGIADTVDEILSALLHEHQLRLRHAGIEGGELDASFDPYTLLVYKKALYVIGFSHYHSQIRRFSIDQLRKVEWLRGQAFTYPRDYEPAEHVGGVFGLVPKAPTLVRIRFQPGVARFVRRRRWDPSQKVRVIDGGGVELTMQLRSTKELLSWVLQWGAQAEVVVPESLRTELAVEAARLTEIYRRPVVEQTRLPLGDA